MTMRKLLIVFLFLEVVAPIRLCAQTKPGTVDIFIGADFNYM